MFVVFFQWASNGPRIGTRLGHDRASIGPRITRSIELVTEPKLPQGTRSFYGARAAVLAPLKKNHLFQNICTHHVRHFIGEAQSRPDRVPIESQYEAHSRPIGKTPQTMRTQHNQIVNMISLHILLLDIAKLSCFLNGPRTGLVMGLDWASTGPRLGHVGSPRHEVR